MKTNVRIGDLLIEKGYVTTQQMDEALAYQKEHRDKRVGQILMELGFVTEHQVLDALAGRLGLEIVNVAELQVDLEAVAKLDKALAEKNLLLPISIQNGVMLLATNDPLNYFALEEVRQQTNCYLKIVLSEEAPLRMAVANYFSEVNAKKAALQLNEGVAAEELEDMNFDEMQGDEEVPIIRLLNSLVERAIKSNASDIHIEPFERDIRVRMRIDGVVLEYVTLPKSVHQSLVARIKIMANLDIAEKRLPQDGHFRMRTDENGHVNVRVSLLPTVFGEKAVLRILATAAKLDYSGQFGMDDFSYQQFLPMLNSANGIIYITGPTGSGKSTTLYMILEYLSSRKVNISTIEDPVEKNVSGIIQTQVNTTAGMTFDVGLRSLLRQDPDIIMVGETRDGETASVSVRAAITGHMVLSTLHTNDAASSITRLEDMGVETYLIANSLVGIVAQRLMRKNCPNCSKAMATTEEERKLIGSDIETVYRGLGCPQCNGTGYKGRIAIHEILPIDATLRKMISEHKTVDEIIAYGIAHQKMRTLKESASKLVREGVTTPEELLKITCM